MQIVHEADAEQLDVPGRKLRWLFHPESEVSDKLSMNVVEIGVGETVKPAHSHMGQEEVIYVVGGHGQVWVDGEVGDLAPGTAVLFPIRSVHMVRNTGSEPLKLACFFAPPADFSAYEYHEEVEFPS